MSCATLLGWRPDELRRADLWEFNVAWHAFARSQGFGAAGATRLDEEDVRDLRARMAEVKRRRR